MSENQKKKNFFAKETSDPNQSVGGNVINITGNEIKNSHINLNVKTSSVIHSRGDRLQGSDTPKSDRARETKMDSVITKSNELNKQTSTDKDKQNIKKGQKMFISYSGQDEEAALKLKGDLKARGYEKVWIDKENLLPGQIWEKEIEKEIRNSDFVILLLSQNSVSRRGFFLKEISFALDTVKEIPEDDIFLIPVRLDNCCIPGKLSRYHCVDLFSDQEDGIGEIITAIEYKSHKRRDYSS